MQQTAWLSQRRKRRVEQSQESNKRHQTDGKAFGAPMLVEEVSKQPAMVVESVKRVNEAPAKNAGSRKKTKVTSSNQTKLTDLLTRQRPATRAAAKAGASDATKEAIVTKDDEKNDANDTNEHNDSETTSSQEEVADDEAEASGMTTPPMQERDEQLKSQSSAPTPTLHAQNTPLTPVTPSNAADAAAKYAYLKDRAPISPVHHKLEKERLKNEVKKQSTRAEEEASDATPQYLPATACIPELEKKRISEECKTLDKLVAALDTTLTFHAARNVTAFFHKIQPMLRNSTRKNIELSHLCKVLFIAPELYDVETKLLKEFSKDVEAHQVAIGKQYTVPMTGKDIAGRNSLIHSRTSEYFEKHQEPNATIPEKSLPKLDKVVDKKEWLKTANLPEHVRSVLELQEKKKEIKEEQAKPRPEPQGTTKQRAKALLERLRNKKKN
ncbi:hypothetical protein BC940DRAFT_370809 [Gongronella butleri]|nr:hypothetical protein BC940DRAFT_370809 [Gongronella butleri]